MSRVDSFNHYIRNLENSFDDSVSNIIHITTFDIIYDIVFKLYQLINLKYRNKHQRIPEEKNIFMLVSHNLHNILTSVNNLYINPSNDCIVRYIYDTIEYRSDSIEV